MEEKTISEKEPNNASDIQSTYNGTVKLITSNSIGIARNTVAAVGAIGGFACVAAAVSLPGGVLIGAALPLFIHNCNNNIKSQENLNSNEKNNYLKP